VLALIAIRSKRDPDVSFKLDRGYDDFVSGRISDAFWSRMSQEAQRPQFASHDFAGRGLREVATKRTERGSL
jgi:hypothetical protein